MSGPRSLRRDLALGLGAGVVALWLLAMAGAWAVLRDEVNEVYDAVLGQAADRILRLPGESMTEPAPEVTPRRGEDMSYILRRPDGAILMRSAGADATVFGETPRTGFRESADYRVFGRRAPGDNVLEVADPLAERREATREAMVSLLVPALALAPLIFFGVAWFVAARLRPVGLLAKQVARRDSADLRPISAPGLQLELIPIQDAVNRLMRRLADAMEVERTFSANAAHELRTPIAAALARTQRLIAQAPEGAPRQGARAIEAELKRMARLSEKLLDLARAEAAGVAAGSGQDLRPILSMVAEDFGAAAGLRVTLPPVPVVASIDPDAFAILARNLIENAILHGTPPIEVALEPDSTLRVTNGGRPLTADKLALLTRRFERLGSRRGGSGLGLAIVEALVRNAGANLEFRSPAPGRDGGLAVIVALRNAEPEVP